MFTLDDIKPLVKVPGAIAVVVRERAENEMTLEMKEEFGKQIKKATKLPVIFVPYKVDIYTTNERLDH